LQLDEPPGLTDSRRFNVPLAIGRDFSILREGSKIETGVKNEFLRGRNELFLNIEMRIPSAHTCVGNPRTQRDSFCLAANHESFPAEYF
jgi:hypothetical protein